MRLTCKIGKQTIKLVTVEPNDELNILLEKLKEYEDVGKTAKFVHKGVTYSLASIFTFAEIKISDNTEINIITPGRAGFIMNKI